MSNHEEKDFVESVDLLMAFQRTKFTDKHACIRHVVKNPDNLQLDIDCLEARLKVIGGEWRIHKTVNKRDVEKARKWLLKHLIDHPEKASFIDSLWRTALLQPECIHGEKRFMFDVDTKDPSEQTKFVTLMCEGLGVPLAQFDAREIDVYSTPKGWHYITKPFDTRQVCELPYVTLLRDGYHFVKAVGGTYERQPA